MGQYEVNYSVSETTGPLWTVPDLKSGISLRELIPT